MADGAQARAALLADLAVEVERIRGQGTGLRSLGTKEKKDSFLGAGSALLEESDRLQEILDKHERKD